jgi:nicotinamide-nucleotide amidase
MQEFAPIAEHIASLLKTRGETIAVAESSAGGLVSAALLAVPGASAFFLGGAVVYTRLSRRVLLGIPDAALANIRPASEAYAQLLATTARDRFGAGWALAETGATGPTGNRYGDAAGHACLAVAGPLERSVTLETGHGDRQANMRTFAGAALDLLLSCLSEAPR